MVYCYANKPGFPPPISGWHIPAGDHPQIECLRVTPLESVAALLKRVTLPQAPAESRGAGTSPSGVKVRPPMLVLPPPPVVHLQHFEFRDTPSQRASLGIQLSSDFPPVILGVQPGSLAAQAGVPAKGTLQAINGRALSAQDNAEDMESAMRALKSRPLTLDIRPPEGSGGPRQEAAGSLPQAGKDAHGRHLLQGKSGAVPPGLVRPPPPVLPNRPPGVQRPGFIGFAPTADSADGRSTQASGTGARVASTVPAGPVVPPRQGQAPRGAGVATHVTVSVPEGAPRRAAVLAAALNTQEAECIEHLLLKVHQERLKGSGRPLWQKIQELAG